MCVVCGEGELGRAWCENNCVESSGNIDLLLRAVVCLASKADRAPLVLAFCCCASAFLFRCSFWSPGPHASTAKQEAAFKTEWVRICREEADQEMLARRRIQNRRKRKELEVKEVLVPTFYK